MTDERITAYLLGELTDEESARFEEQCFAREEWPAEVSLAEDDLIDAYLQGELTAERRRLFEQNYLTTGERCRRVATAAGFLRHVGSLGANKDVAPEPARQSWAARFNAFLGSGNWALRAGLAFGVVVLIAGAVWVLRSRTASPRAVATLTLTLSDEATRAEGVRAPRVSLPADADTLRIHLKLPDPSLARAARYRAELVDEEGGASPAPAALGDSESVTVDLPAARLQRGQYALRLFTSGPDGAEQRVRGSYYFIVE